MVIEPGFSLKCLDVYAKKWVKKSRGSKRSYLNIPIAYDIEVSSYLKRGDVKRFAVYSHCVAVFDHVWLFRTWDDILLFFDKLAEYFKAGNGKYVVIYVHNLSFEYAFMRARITPREVFANGDRRKIGYARTDTLEFRCSYMESGMSLKRISEMTTYKKMVGDLDYKLLRSPLTSLSDKELGYIYNDVLVLTEYIEKKMKENGDISKIPYTLTGYVRREVRNALRKSSSYNKNFMKNLTCTGEEMGELRRCYHGGFTHANARFTGLTLENVASVDATSFYPTQYASRKFPMSKGRILKARIDDIEKLVDNQNFCIMFKVRLSVTRKGETGTISESHIEDPVDVSVDNGRISSGEFTVTLTDADFRAMRRMYFFTILKLYFIICYEADYLPAWFVSKMLKFYEEKTKLKGVKGRDDDYRIRKVLINSFYGMSAQDPIRDEFKVGPDGLMELQPPKDIFESCEKVNADKNRCTFYPWAVWCTAYAQESIFECIEELGEDWVYTDTDSVKFVNPEKHLQWFRKKSEEVYADIHRMLDRWGLPHDLAFPKDIYGKVHPLGTWDHEGTYDLFKTLGAKRYLTYTGDVLALTCAGAHKVKGAEFIAKEWDFDGEVHFKGQDIKKVFDRFNDGLVIPAGDSGRSVHSYIDEPFEDSLNDYQGVRCDISEKSGIYIEESDYSLNISKAYCDYLVKIGNFALTSKA